MMRFLPALLMTLASIQLQAQAELQCLPEQGTPLIFVYDYAEVLTPAAEAQINSTILALQDTTSNSIVVVTHPDMCGGLPLTLRPA